MLLKFLGVIVQVLHCVFMVILWLTPLYLRSPRYMILSIAILILIMMHQYMLSGRCIVTMLEEQLLQKRLMYGNGQSMAGFNSFLVDWFGLDGMLAINIYIPYIVLFALCYKLYVTVRL